MSLINEIRKHSYRRLKEKFKMENSLKHYGILGMKWGVRRYQNADGTLTEAGKKRQAKKDTKWAYKNEEKLRSKAYKSSKKELKSYQKELLQQEGAVTKSGKLSAKTINSYNNRMAQLMTQAASSTKAPSGLSVKFVAKRGEVGVMMALASESYDVSQLSKGVWANGRVAYTSTVLDSVSED